MSLRGSDEIDENMEIHCLHCTMVMIHHQADCTQESMQVLKQSPLSSEFAKLISQEIQSPMKKLIVILALLLVVSLVGWWLLGGESSYPITNANPTGTTIIAFGDSLTEGKGAGKELAYPAILSEKTGVQILNMGVSGDTAADGLKRLDRDVLSRDPKIVLLAFGGNDFLRKLDKNATFDQLRQMIRAIQQTGALVILISVDFPLGGSWTRMYRELAQETGCPHVPDQLGGIFGHRDLMSDEVHPNAKGYAIMAEKIEPVLRNYLD